MGWHHDDGKKHIISHSLCSHLKLTSSWAIATTKWVVGGFEASGDDLRVAATKKMPPPAAVGIEDVVVRCGEEGGGESMCQACSELAFCGCTS